MTVRQKWELQFLAEETEETGKKPNFEELIKGECKEQFEAKVQKILDGRLRSLRQENEQLRGGIARQREQEQQAMETLSQSAEEIRKMYPAFDWQQELGNENFRRLIVAGIDGRSAYEMVHREELMRRAMRYAAKQAGEQLSRAIASGGRHVAENGGRSIAVSRNDPRGLSPRELAQIRQRVMNGEKISF